MATSTPPPSAGGAANMSAHPASSYSSPPLTATAAPSQTLPTPPTSESEIAKSYPVSMSPHVPESTNTSSAMLARRQNASLPAFTLPSSNQRNFSYSGLGTSASAQSLLTPPVMGNETLSPLQNGAVYSNLGGYWSSNNGPSSASYTYGSASSTQPGYSSVPALSNPVPYNARVLYSPSRERPISPSTNDIAAPSSHSSPYESVSYPTTMSMPSQSQAVTSNLSYGSPYTYNTHQHQSPISHGPNGIASPHDPYSPISSLPPPTPTSQPYYSQQNQSYQYSTTSPNHRSNSASTMHPPSHMHPAPSVHYSSRYATSPNVFSQHGPSVMQGSLGGHLGASPSHLHAPPHGSHSASQADRPFKCDQCPQSFNRNHDLKRHKRIHLAVKPFPCPNCDKSFSRKDALKRHVLVKGCGNGSSSKSNGNSSSSS